MILKSAVLAHFMLKERLRQMGVLGCLSCIVGSVIIVIHAPQEHTPSSVQEVWDLASQPGLCLFLWIFTIVFIHPLKKVIACLAAFLIYVAASLSIVLALILHFEPLYGQTNILIYLGICSLMGALTVNCSPSNPIKYICWIFKVSLQFYIVWRRYFCSLIILFLKIVSIKAIGIAIKLTLEGNNQFGYMQTWFFVSVTVICVITQLNYLNKVTITRHWPLTLLMSCFWCCCLKKMKAIN